MMKKLEIFNSEHMNQDEIDIASFIHESVCNGIDCGWYGGDETDWYKSERRYYLKKAQDLLKITDYDNLVKIFDIIF